MANFGENFIAFVYFSTFSFFYFEYLPTEMFINFNLTFIVLYLEPLKVSVYEKYYLFKLNIKKM